MRVRLLNHLVGVGPSTATEGAEIAGPSASACSYHLRHLGRFGLVERLAPPDGADGRERWWRAAATGLSVLPTPRRHDVATRTALVGLLVDAAELRELVQRVDAVLRPYLAVTRTDAPDGARATHVTLQAFPRVEP